MNQTRRGGEPVRALRFARFWQATAWLLLTAVVVMSLIPVPPSPPVLTWDKSQHAVSWGVLSWWFLQAWEGRRPMGWCLFLLATAALVELLQGTTGYRTSDWLDMLANTVGLAIGLTLWFTPAGGAFHWMEHWVGGRRYP